MNSHGVPAEPPQRRHGRSAVHGRAIQALVAVKRGSETVTGLLGHIPGTAAYAERWRGRCSEVVAARAGLLDELPSVPEEQQLLWRLRAHDHLAVVAPFHRLRQFLIDFPHKSSWWVIAIGLIGVPFTNAIIQAVVEQF